VRHADRGTRTIVAEYDLSRGGALMEGHFPGQPVWPGLLQVEAIGQAGMLMTRVERPHGPPGVITDVLGARFLRIVRPPGRLRVVARVITEEPFDLVVGQCLFEGEVCSAAVLRGLETAGEGGV
jgi:3-hydroxymyristoyl/3-hydroxydecanoyl-(acyl carrier protein) dehydratase